MLITVSNNVIFNFNELSIFLAKSERIMRVIFTILALDNVQV